MAYYLAAFLSALVVCTALTPGAKWLASRLGAVSEPGGRHVNGQNIPRLGGLAISLAWAGPLLVLALTSTRFSPLLSGHGRHLIGIVGGGLLLCLVGALDDLKGLRAVHKLAAQLVVATGAFALGFRIEGIFLPFIGTLEMGAFALPITLLWIVGVTNAVNLIDGLDGLAAGIAFFAALTSFVIAHLSNSPFVALSMVTLMGALVGFLFFNFNPARIFMGDSGSYFLGYLLATTALTGGLQQKASTAVSLLVPIIALGLPIFDTLFSMVRRLLERRSIFSPDRGHIHHRLLELGLTHRRAVMLLYGVSIVLAGGAIAVSLGRSWEIGIALFSVSAVFVALVRFLGYFGYLHQRRRQKSRFYDENTNRVRLALKLVLPQVQSAPSEQALLEALPRLLSVADLASIALVVDGNNLREWARPGSNPGGREAVHSTFPVGRDDCAKAKLRFCWSNVAEGQNPQVEVLLQLFVDLFAEGLTRVASSLAPVRETQAEPLRSEATREAPALS
jgi:UDP-GlcNAc:undecaprenyl-phosphate GlcNAc-1-phosphate transferase